MQTDGARFSELLNRFAGRRILAIGDLMLDEFIWGKVSRISPEAPVPIVNVTGESYYPGGAANVARNLRECTETVSLMGMTGEDAAGQRLIGLLEQAGIDTSGVQRIAAATTVKTRIIARNQQVVRVDRERKTALDETQAARAVEYLNRTIPELDAVVVADYGKGFVSQELADEICRTAQRHGTIVAVDPHPHTSLRWSGVALVKPNRTEAFLAAGLPQAEPVMPVSCDCALLEAGERLSRMWECESLLITLGEHGMLLLRPEKPPYHIPTRAKDVFDVSGAGDTAIAALTAALAAGATPVEAADIANCASGIAVGKLGTAVVSMAELRAGLVV